MSKEQKTLKSCYILDRLREWFELYGNQNHQRAEEELHLAIDELYEYQQKDQRIADLEAKLADSEEEHELLIDQFEEETEKLRKQIKQESDARKRLVEEVKNLRQQLTESKKQCQECKHLNKKIELNIKNKLMAENCELQKQLGEKEKEITYLTKQVKRFNNEAQKYFEDAYCNDFHNQDKISFAVEVLKIAQDYVQQYVNNFDDMNDCLCAIDNQIKRLTHQHEDKGE